MRKVSAKMLIGLFVLALQGYAQTITGSITGRIVDQQGATVANAAVTAAEPARKVTVTTKSTASGDFYVAGLLPGTYTVTVVAPGFKKLSHADVVIDASDKISLGDLIVQVGAVTESIEVSATAATLQTESVERSGTISGKQVENIEVNGRNPLDMAKLIPGVAFQTGNTYAVGNSATGGNQFVANGARPSQNQVTLNGIGDVDTGNNGGLNVSVSIDSIAEFKILTGTYQAEYGRSAGAQVQLVTKTGTSQFHGSGYWYHRNESLNANTWLNNIRPQFGQAAIPKPLFRYNDPGYTIGGPIFIPKIFERAKNKAFFFFSEEWQNQLQPNTARNVTVPTALERKGDFSQSVDNNHNPIAQILDPLNQTPFPGKVVPQSRIYAPGQALLNVFPMPSIALAANASLPTSVNYNYTSQLPGKIPRREDLLRLDYNVRDSLRVFGHYINDVQPTVVPYGSFVLGLNVPIAPVGDPIPGRSIAAGATYVVSPTMTNEFNWGYTKNSINIFATNDGLSRKATGISLPVLFPNAVQDDYIPQVSFGGHLANSSSFGTSNAPFINYNTTIDFSDNLTKVWGKHTIKTGVYFQRSRKDQTSFAAFNGSYNFSDSTSNPYDTGYTFSNALLGVYNTFGQASNHINGQYRYWNMEQFVQDTWKITPRLTLDYGLRGQWYQPQYDASKQASSFVLANWDPKKAPRLYFPGINPANNQRQAYDSVANVYMPSFDIGLEIPNSGDPFNGICQAGGCLSKYLTRNRGEQWGPRFGVAWDVTGKQNIVIRTGAGIFYDRVQGNRTFDLVTNPPEALSETLTFGLASTINPATALIAPPSLVAADPTGKVPTLYSYQFSVQTRLPWSLMLDTAYVGSSSRHLSDNKNLNWSPFGTTFTQAATDPTAGTGCSGCSAALGSGRLLGSNALPQNFEARIYGYSNINLYESQATSNYNSLQVQLQRRSTKGLFFGVSYTYSKVLSTSQSGGTNDNSFVRPDQFNRLANYAPASFDRRQVLAVNYVYSIPKPEWNNHLIRAVADGWQVSGVTIVQTGQPFTPSFGITNNGNSQITGSYTEGARIGVVQGCDPYTHSSNPFNRLNAACFFAPSMGSVGLESGINYLYAPGGANFDMAIQKMFTLKEKFHFQFRVDAFNVFNHTIFTGINSGLNFNAYPGNSSGGITGPPTLTSTTLAINNPAQGCTTNCSQIGGFGSVTQSGPGAFGYSRILQTVIRVTF